MKLLQIERDELLKPLQAVTGIVERRHTLPILSNVLIEREAEQLQLVATDLEIQVSTRRASRERRHGRTEPHRLGAQASGHPAIAARRREARAGRAEQSPSGESGQEPIQSADVAGERFPAARRCGPGAGERERLPQKVLKELLLLVQFSMAQQDIRYYLNGMLLVLDKGADAGRRDRRPPPELCERHGGRRRTRSAK